MIFKTNKTALTENDIQAALIAHDADFRRKIKLKRYYRGEHGILHKQARANTEVNNKLVSNYPAYISNMSVGFFIGQPVTYTAISKDEHELAPLLEIFKYNDEAAHNLDLAEEASITGVAYEFLYLDGAAKIRMATVPSEEVILICDATLESNITAAIRHYRIYGLDMVSCEEFVDVYDSREVRHYIYNGNLTLIDSEPHYFDDVPIIEYPNNKQRRGDFEDVITLVDAYNLAQSLTMDDLEDFTDAFLVLKGLGGTSPEDARKLRKDKVIVLDGDDAGAEWLIKNLNDTYVENIKTRLQRDIHKFAAIPDMSDDNFAGNTSGVAIKYKLIGLEQIRSRKEREFKRALQRRIELISGILQLKSQAQIDFRDIDIKFTANIPANLQEQAQVVTTLDGLVSQKTLLGLLPFISDPIEELEELSKERAETFSDGEYFNEHTHGADSDIGASGDDE